MRKILCKKNRKVNKKGFTLVELLVSVAILAVISMSLVQFVFSTTNAYRKSSSTTTVQETCRDTLTQISNIVRNSKSLKVIKSADGGITMKSENYEGKNILLIYVPDDSKENDYGRIYVCYDYSYDIPEGEEGSLVDITSNDPGEKYNDYLLTDMVKSFTVDFSTYKATDEDGNEYTVVQERTLDMVLSLERNDKSFTQDYKASLRNSSPEGQTAELVIEMENEVIEEE